MPTLDIDGLSFEFPDNWRADKYDDWVFYRKHFSTQLSGIKAVDAIAVSDTGAAFLIEVKDYRHPDTEKPSELPAAIAWKVIHTLAAIVPAKLRANNATEMKLADAVTACTALRVIAHIELPQGHRGVVDLADIKQKLAQLLRAVDPHPKVVSMNKMQGLEWVVR